jgi:hypothetical protein
METNLIDLQNFVERLNKEPDPAELKNTPDGKAKDLPISYVEMTLDELFFGQWGTRSFQWSVISNEVQGALELFVIHPYTGKELIRTGAASIQIMVDKAPDGMVGQERNRWYLTPENKKPNALDMAFPKLKAECTKNAAKSLGKLFGRDLNRKEADVFKPVIRIPSPEVIKLIEARILKGELSAVSKAKQLFDFDDLTLTYFDSLLTQKQIAQ